MGLKSRTKGASGEREFINLLLAELIKRIDKVPTLKRNLRQYQEKGLDDVSGIPWARIEVKRYRTATDAQVAGWWIEAQQQAAGQDAAPVLAYRADKQQWRVVVPVWLLRSKRVTADQSHEPVTISIAILAGIVQAIVAEELQEEHAWLQ